MNLLKTQSNKANSSKIEALVNAIDLNSVKIYTLKTTEKLLVADLKSLKGFETSNKTKAIFFVYENEITHSNIVTFNVKVPFDNLDKVMLSVLDMKKNKDNYTGKISFYNMYQNISLSNEFENGKLTFNGIARRKITKSIIGKSAGCIDWYWVTNSSYEYLYTTCDPCEAYRMSGIKCGGGGGGGSSSGTSGPAYPSNPKNNDLYTYIDQDGEAITKKYNGVTGEWDFFLISLSDVITYSNPAKSYYLIIQWPTDQQRVLHGSLVYIYDAASGNWEGMPMVEEEINPCDQIKIQIDNTLIKEKINGLKGKTGNKDESGIVQKKDGNFVDLIASTNSNELNMPRGTDFIGWMHTHQDPYPSGKFREDGTPIMLRPILIFSPKDVVQFLEFLNNTKINSALIANVYSTMILSSATYQLRFTGNINDVKIKFDILDLNIKYIKSIKDNGNDKKLGFLKFLEETIGIKGIDLYEINSDNSTNKIVLVNNNLSNVPCK